MANLIDQREQTSMNIVIEHRQAKPDAHAVVRLTDRFTKGVRGPIDENAGEDFWFVA